MSAAKVFDAYGHTLEQALRRAFLGYGEGANGEIEPRCCGKVAVRSGWMGQAAKCERCGMAVVDGLSPLYSPLLRRGNSYLTIPGDEMLKAAEGREYLVLDGDGELVPITPSASNAETSSCQSAGLSTGRTWIR